MPPNVHSSLGVQESCLLQGRTKRRGCKSQGRANSPGPLRHRCAIVCNELSLGASGGGWGESDHVPQELIEC